MPRSDPTRIDELRAATLPFAAAPGRHALRVPGVTAIRADQPILRKGWSPTLSLGVILQGRKRVHVGGRDHLYQAGQYLVITGEAETEAEILQASPRLPYLSLSIQVDPAMVARLLIALSGDSPPTARREPAAPAYTSALGGPLADVLLRLLKAAGDATESRILGPLLLEELTFRLLGSEWASVLRQVACRGDDQRRVQAALAYIRDNAAKPLTVEKIARHVAMSPSHFAHRFRDIVRVSPMRYLKHVRLQEARLLMLHGGARPEAAARAVGYASASHFARDFKRHFEQPPAQHIEQLRAEARLG